MFVTAVLLLADGGVLIPRDKAHPIPRCCLWKRWRSPFRIDNGDARIFVRQVFANHTGHIEKGKLHLRLARQPRHGYRLSRWMGLYAFPR